MMTEIKLLPFLDEQKMPKTEFGRVSPWNSWYVFEPVEILKEEDTQE